MIKKNHLIILTDVKKKAFNKIPTTITDKTFSKLERGGHNFNI